MTDQLVGTRGPEDSFQNAAGLLDTIGRLMASETEDHADRTVYRWGGSKAGEDLVASVPKGRGPIALEVGAISRTFRKALRSNKLDDPIESGVTITLNTPESGQPAIDIRVDTRSLGNLAIGLFGEFASSAGLLHPATVRQRVGRAILSKLETWLGSF
jgi:hypothetical protein